MQSIDSFINEYIDNYDSDFVFEINFSEMNLNGYNGILQDVFNIIHHYSGLSMLVYLHKSKNKNFYLDFFKNLYNVNIKEYHCNISSIQKFGINGKAFLVKKVLHNNFSVLFIPKTLPYDFHIYDIKSIDKETLTKAIKNI